MKRLGYYNGTFGPLEEMTRVFDTPNSVKPHRLLFFCQIIFICIW